ncbi:MAG: hypothetical protein QM576_10180 [Rhodopseudomonas sp.]|uniref:hypothetical protein n=1 Tax=Rhodopseudomonas sp. TaxID=1078 RepID=UPI0039E66ED1
MNMSLNIDDPQFYNLAWRGEAIAEEWLRLRIVLRQSTNKPRQIFLEMNPPLMVHKGTANPIFYYRDYISPEDARTFRDSRINYQLPLLTQLAGEYRRDIPWLALRYTEGGSISPDPERLHFKIQDNGFSYNLIPDKTFPSPISRSTETLHIHPNFDYFFNLLIQEAQSHGIKVILVTTPMFPTLREAISAGTWKETRQYIDAACARFGLTYFDFSRFSDDAADFWNEDHMSLAGAKRFGEFAHPILMPNAQILQNEPKYRPDR